MNVGQNVGKKFMDKHISQHVWAYYDVIVCVCMRNRREKFYIWGSLVMLEVQGQYNKYIVEVKVMPMYDDDDMPCFEWKFMFSCWCKYFLYLLLASHHTPYIRKWKSNLHMFAFSFPFLWFWKKLHDIIMYINVYMWWKFIEENSKLHFTSRGKSSGND